MQPNADKKLLKFEVKNLNLPISMEKNSVF